jgi:hypothetical protein
MGLVMTEFLEIVHCYRLKRNYNVLEAESSSVLICSREMGEATVEGPL